MSAGDMLKKTTLDRVNILGVGVNPITIDLAVRIIDGWISRGEQHYICVTGVHGIMESQRDEILRHIHNAAGLVTPDGMPLVWLSALKGYRGVERVYGPDLMLAVCKDSTPNRYRHFLYGGTPVVLERLSCNLQLRFPTINVVGAYSPPFRPLTPDEDDKVVQLINSANPQIIWIGLNTPKQEFWMANHLGKLNAPVMIGVGAAFDFHAGTKKQAPRWIQRSGLEWLFRLSTEPQRLWRRYLINNPLFILLVLAQALGIKRYPSLD
jgi:N-acetylglucosaminyldiphosphoundecaprenol N-acetyl-beta-D-mannosaminyltransferase